MFYENPSTLIKNSITRNRTRKSWNDKAETTIAGEDIALGMETRSGVRGYERLLSIKGKGRKVKIK